MPPELRAGQVSFLLPLPDLSGGLPNERTGISMPPFPSGYDSLAKRVIGKSSGPGRKRRKEWGRSAVRSSAGQSM